MALKLVVAVTDSAWFEYLRSKQNLAEVNFWAPSGAPFRALEWGELFLFKLHAPHNYIVGGGVFTYATVLPSSLAWAAFGEANGAANFLEMRKRIAHYRHNDLRDQADFQIGCRILTQPFFLDEIEWIPVQAPNSPLKTYAVDEPDGRHIWDAVQKRVAFGPQGLSENESLRFGEPVLVRPRLGQGAFRVLVTDSYNRRCSITGERTLPALDAAHIRPFGDGGLHDVSNGLLLRRDIHSLFDAGYVTVTPDYRFEVSHRIREEFENGRHYYALNGQPIGIPIRLDRQPDKHALAWHNENVFKG